MTTQEERFNLLKELEFIVSDSKLETMANVEILKPFSYEQIMEAFIAHKSSSPYAMKVCDVVEYWKRKAGQTTAQLEQRAAMIYEKFFKYPKTGYDHVADKRTVYAFKVAFGSLIEYGNRTDYIDGVDKKDFIKAYVNARPEDYEHAGNVLEGHNHRCISKDFSVVCIGESARQLARQIYGEGVRDANALPLKRPQALENKAVKVDHEGQKKVRDLIANFLNSVGVKHV